MNRYLYYFIPIVIIALSVLVMTGGEYLKMARGDGDDLTAVIESVSIQVRSGEWESAQSKASQLEDAWQKMISRVQFNAERDEINGLTDNIAKLKGYIEAHDKGGALAELQAANQHWRDLGQ